MNKTLSDLLRLFILVNLIILAFLTLPQSKPGAPTTAVAKPALPAQTSTRFYLKTSVLDRESNEYTINMTPQINEEKQSFPTD